MKIVSVNQEFRNFVGKLLGSFCLKVAPYTERRAGGGSLMSGPLKLYKLIHDALKCQVYNVKCIPTCSTTAFLLMESGSLIDLCSQNVV